MSLSMPFRLAWGRCSFRRVGAWDLSVCRLTTAAAAHVKTGEMIVAARLIVPTALCPFSSAQV